MNSQRSSNIALFAITSVLLVALLTSCGPEEDENLYSADNQPQDIHSSGDGDNGDNGDNGESDGDSSGDSAPEEPLLRDYRGPLGPSDREVTPALPREYDEAGNHPLLLLLHGIGSNASQTIAFFGVSQIASQAGYLVLAPEGTIDSANRRFWNATSRCCDFDNTGVDDVGYLSNLIDEAIEKYAVDPDQIYIMGLSNGGFMAHRLACDHGDKIRAIVSFNGGTTISAASCAPEHPVYLFHVHSTADTTVPYTASLLAPSARDAVTRWADWNQCDPAPRSAPNINATATIPGNETTVEVWENCMEGGGVEFWSLQGAAHVPFPLADFPEEIMNSLQNLR